MFVACPADNYLGTDQISFTLNFSKGASQIVAQYYQVSTVKSHSGKAESACDQNFLKGIAL
jgi:glutamate/tyrosine decarboxylase-like PLP-dependent enzyme